MTTPPALEDSLLPPTLRSTAEPWWPLGPADAAEAADDALVVRAGPRTDRFVDPRGLACVLNAPGVVADLAAEGDYQLSARVSATSEAAYDAAALLLWSDESSFAKLCFELSPQGTPMVVSVVTRGTSDDANAFVVDGTDVWLRVSTLGTAFAFHASVDGRRWDIIRYFTLGADRRPAVGFHAQSPVGEGCTATFRDIQLRREPLQDPRDGS